VLIVDEMVGNWELWHFWHLVLENQIRIVPGGQNQQARDVNEALIR